jgi:hypothetical protein
MIAPTEALCKGRRDSTPALQAPAIQRRGGGPYRHGIVSQIIMPPHFRLSGALLNCEKNRLRWPGPFDTGFLSPQPPGVVGTGPIAEELIR